MYRVPMRQISGGPDWSESDRYDVEAKADHHSVESGFDLSRRNHPNQLLPHREH